MEGLRLKDVRLSRFAAASPDEAAFDPAALPAWQSYALLTSHIGQKGLQAGGVFGALYAGVRVALSKGQRPVHAVLTDVGLTTAGMVAISLGLGAYKMAGFESRDSVDDRVYKLHYNEGQAFVDRLAGYSAVVGAGVAALMVLGAPPQAAPLLGVVGGAGLGAAGGVLVGMAAIRDEKTAERKMPSWAATIKDRAVIAGQKIKHELVSKD
ncbi:unnamed protein product [Pedinophyceae sp. YPF-701]|nr:unnamed protein product [Pedinophyceae sp. YPF-701]